MTEPRTLANFIGGAWVAPATGRYADDVNPADPSDVVARVPLSGADDASAAVAAAKAAFPAWKRTSPVRRGQMLVAASRILAERKDELVAILTREQGKPLAEARGEVPRAVDFWSWMGHQGGSIQGITAPSEVDTIQVMTLREPLGVISLITPWNFPVNIPGWKLASALVCGNTVVLKPSQLTPVCAEFLIKCLHDAGIPDGVVNLVFGSGREVGDTLVGHPDVAAISFTGSTETGLAINQKASQLGKPVQAEMGGHNAVIVLADADLDKAAKGSVVAAFGTTGQRCTAARRIIADRSVVEPLTARLTELTGKLKVGPGTADGVDVGPLVDESALNSVLEHIEVARNEGARVLAGGNRVRGELERGYFIEPTLLANVSPRMTIAREEVFGPVLPIMPVNGYDEAIEIATSTQFGLSSSIFTRDINTAFRFMHETDTGVVHINKPPIGGESHLPFGGLKNSALGPKEMGAAVEFFTQTKTVYVDWG
ncbi:MAG: aldehyde dehydrogenase family protein [Chloroflexota bacterium]|nr:aldehyde dehydrogenase family protein [Chloroflexota bacterium]